MNRYSPAAGASGDHERSQMAESEEGVGTTKISRRKAIKLGALGAAGGAAAWLLPGTASGGRSLGAPPGICPRGSGDVCGRQIRQCGTSKGDDSFGALCVCASDSRSPATHCVEDRPDLQFSKCSTRFDCDYLNGQLCVKRCIDLSPFLGSQKAGPNQAQQFEVVTSICAWPCSTGPGFGED